MFTIIKHEQQLFIGQICLDAIQRSVAGLFGTIKEPSNRLGYQHGTQRWVLARPRQGCQFDKPIAAWIALAEGKNDEALALIQQSITLEAATGKNPVTPGPLKLALDDPAAALQAFEASQPIEPNRFMGLYGAARAAELAGDMEKATGYYEQLVTLGAMADSDRAELAAAQAFLTQE